jgi:twitching motility protein PilT
MTRELDEQFEALLRKAAARNARSLFLTSGEEPAIRTERGNIERLGEEPVSGEAVLRMAESAAGKEPLKALGREAGQIRGSCCLEGELNGWFVVTLSGGDPTICVRLMPGTIPSMDDIRLPDSVRKAAESPSGLVLLSGPVGAGMQTTAYSLLDHLNERAGIHICTVEVPVAAKLTPKRAIVHQINVGEDVPEFVDGMLAAYSQDPDVLYLAEIPTTEVVRGCFNWALSGHLVVGVLHVTDRPELVIQQIVDAFPPQEQKHVRNNLAQTLRCLCVQRLLPGVERAFVPAYGVLVPDEEMRRSVAEGSDVHTRKTPMPAGCLEMEADIAVLSGEDLISEETARRFGA